VKLAIKVATDAGRYELAAQLLDVLIAQPKRAPVVRLETVKGGR
jgi:hypothetical protein